MRRDWYLRRRFRLVASLLMILSVPFNSPQIKAESGHGSANRCKKEESNAKPAAPDSAAAAVQAVIDGLKKGEAVVLWDCLPASYQQEVNDIVRKIARQEDPELWNRFFTTAQRMLKILRTKDDFFFNYTSYQPGSREERAQEEAQVRQLIRFAEAIVNSDISDIQKLRAFDGRAFFAGNITSTLKQFLTGTQRKPVEEFVNSLSKIKAKDVKAGANVTVVRITAPFDAKGQILKVNERKFVKQEGKWIPKELAEKWKAEIAIIKQTAPAASLLQAPSELYCQAFVNVINRCGEKS